MTRALDTPITSEYDKPVHEDGTNLSTRTFRNLVFPLPVCRAAHFDRNEMTRGDYFAMP